MEVFRSRKQHILIGFWNQGLYMTSMLYGSFATLISSSGRPLLSIIAPKRVAGHKKLLFRGPLSPVLVCKTSPWPATALTATRFKTEGLDFIMQNMERSCTDPCTLTYVFTCTRLHVNGNKSGTFILPTYRNGSIGLLSFFGIRARKTYFCACKQTDFNAFFFLNRRDFSLL